MESLPNEEVGQIVEGALQEALQTGEAVILMFDTPAGQVVGVFSPVKGK